MKAPLIGGFCFIFEEFMDITKCSSRECPLRKTCYRFTALPDYYMQSYSKFEYHLKNGEVKCEFYWSNK